MEEILEEMLHALADVHRGLKAEASVYQGWLKREVAQVSGIPYAKLAHLPYADWAEIRRAYCGANNRLLPEWREGATNASA